MPRQTEPPLIPEGLRHAMRGLLLDELALAEAEARALREALVTLERDGRYDLRHDELDGLIEQRVGDLADDADNGPSEWGTAEEFERLGESFGYAVLSLDVVPS